MKSRIAIVGFGNIGRFALDAINASDDFECAGVVRRQLLKDDPALAMVTVTNDVTTLGKVDVALLCLPSRSIALQAKNYLTLGINTVDSFDIHSDILPLKQELQPFACQNNAVSVIAAGWDPGSDSLLRALMLTMAPRGLTYTNFGPGMSMGHSVAAKAVEGVHDALSMTIPLGTGLHRRMVYVELAPEADLAVVSQKIKQDSYFKNDETHVKVVSSIAELKDMGHGVEMLHKGVSGQSHNQQFRFEMRINNPALTAQIMLSAARASLRQSAGVYTLIEIPLVDFLPGDKDQWIQRLV